MMRSVALLLFPVLLIVPAAGQQAATPEKAHSQPATAAALPADAPSREQLLKLFDAMEIQKQLSSMMNTMGGTIEKMMPSSMGALSEKQKGDFTKLQTELLTKMMSPDFVDAYLAELIPIYQRHFTKAEVDALIAFYASAIGQKFLREQPQLTQESLTQVIPLMQKRVQDVMDQINYEQRIKEIFADPDQPAASRKK